MNLEFTSDFSKSFPRPRMRERARVRVPPRESVGPHVDPLPTGENGNVIAENLRHFLLFPEQSYPLVDDVELDQPIPARIAHHAQRLAAFFDDLDLLAHEFS